MCFGFECFDAVLRYKTYHSGLYLTLPRNHSAQLCSHMRQAVKLKFRKNFIYKISTVFFQIKANKKFQLLHSMPIVVVAFRPQDYEAKQGMH